VVVAVAVEFVVVCCMGGGFVIGGLPGARMFGCVSSNSLLAFGRMSARPSKCCAVSVSPSVLQSNFNPTGISTSSYGPPETSSVSTTRATFVHKDLHNCTHVFLRQDVARRALEPAALKRPLPVPVSERELAATACARQASHRVS
jgi:hypothetical protein